MEKDLATGSKYLADPRVDRHQYNQNTHCIFPSYSSHVLLQTWHISTKCVLFLKQFCQVFIDPPNMCSSGWLGSVSISSNPLEGFQVRVGTQPDPANRALPHINPDSCNLASTTT